MITTGQFEALGRPLKMTDPNGDVANGLQNKTLFDGAGRQIATYVTTDATESSYGHSLSASDDRVIEQTATYYDKDGRDVLDVSFKRKNNSPATGLLTSENSWSQSTVNWYDAADRMIESANYGSEYRDDYDDSGNLLSSPPTRVIFIRSTAVVIDTNANGIPDVADNTPPAPPTSANETNYGYIVSQYGYDAGGRLYRTIDNKGRSHKSSPRMRTARQSARRRRRSCTPRRLTNPGSPRRCTRTPRPRRPPQPRPFRH